MAYDEDLAERIRAVVHRERNVTEKRMFGGLAFLLDGHMAVAASSKGGLMLRVGPDQADALLADPVARPMEMRGKPAKGWLRVDTDGMDDATFERWVDIGVRAVATLPPKSR